jgi:hypothetical protein
LVLLNGLFCCRGVDAWIGVGGIDGVGLSSGTSGSFDNTLNWFEVLNTFEKQNLGSHRQDNPMLLRSYLHALGIELTALTGMWHDTIGCTYHKLYTSFLPSDRLVTCTAWIDSRILWFWVWIDVIRDGYQEHHKVDTQMVVL